MRLFVALALCLVAAQANAWSAAESVKCVGEEFARSVNAAFDDMKERADKIGDHKDESVKKLEEELQQIQDEFNSNLEAEMKGQRENEHLNSQCDNGSIARRLACQVARNVAIAADAASVAGISLSKALTALSAHAKDFGGSRHTDLREIIHAVRVQMPTLLQSARKCFTN